MRIAMQSLVVRPEEPGKPEIDIDVMAEDDKSSPGAQVNVNIDGTCSKRVQVEFIEGKLVLRVMDHLAPLGREELCRMPLED